MNWKFAVTRLLADCALLHNCIGSRVVTHSSPPRRATCWATVEMVAPRCRVLMVDDEVGIQTSNDRVGGALRVWEISGVAWASLG